MSDTAISSTVRDLDLMYCGSPMLVRADDGSIYRIRKMLDDDPINPRTEDGNIGTMVCWHSRYNLGDEMHKEDPHDWMAELLRFHTSGTPDARLVYDALYSGKCRLSRLVYSDDELKLYEHKNGELVDMVTSVTVHDPKEELPDWFLDDCCNALTTGEILDILEKMDFIFLPLYLYDHSGLSISTSDFGDRWDSGQIGWIFTNKDKVTKLGVRWDKVKVKEYLETEVKEYNKYVSGEVYGISIEEFDPQVYDLPEDACDTDFTETDSCWGFFDAEDMDDFIRSTIGDYEPYEAEPRSKNEKELPPVEEANFKCVFCGGTVTGRYLGPKKQFTGTCQNCGAEYHQPPKAAPRG